MPETVQGDRKELGKMLRDLQSQGDTLALLDVTEKRSSGVLQYSHILTSDTVKINYIRIPEEEEGQRREQYENLEEYVQSLDDEALEEVLSHAERYRNLDDPYMVPPLVERGI